MKIFIIIFYCIIVLIWMITCSIEVQAHGTHAGTGAIINTCYGVFNSKLFMVSFGERDEEGRLQCAQLRHMAVLIHEGDRHPVFHLIGIFDCGEWEAFCEDPMLMLDYE